jgi:hypothetical protein
MSMLFGLSGHMLLSPLPRGLLKVESMETSVVSWQRMKGAAVAFCKVTKTDARWSSDREMPVVKLPLKANCTRGCIIILQLGIDTSRRHTQVWWMTRACHGCLLAKPCQVGSFDVTVRIN